METRLLDGDPVHALERETEGLGLLVCGSRAHGPLCRVMVGSVSSAVIHRPPARWSWCRAEPQALEAVPLAALSQHTRRAHMVRSPDSRSGGHEPLSPSGPSSRWYFR